MNTGNFLTFELYTKMRLKDRDLIVMIDNDIIKRAVSIVAWSRIQNWMRFVYRPIMR
mgnify:CR=1 FL=1